MAETLRLTAQIWREDDAFVVHCPELDVTTQGDSYEHALEMIKEACELTIEDTVTETRP
jgi:predicted RNase H-like HicB family nuclease